MVCTTCEKKLQAVACPEKWKEGSNSRKVGSMWQTVRASLILQHVMHGASVILMQHQASEWRAKTSVGTSKGGGQLQTCLLAVFCCAQQHR
jgi:hypothetical protein